MINRPTMSDTDQLLACTWPYGREIERESNRYSELGTEAHAIFAAAINVAAIVPKFKVPTRVAARHRGTPAGDRAEAGLKALAEWWENTVGQDAILGIEVETSYAVTITGRDAMKKPPRVRKIEPADPKTHEYADARASELPGTLDFLAVLARSGGRRPTIIDLDFKTGMDTPTPMASGQLKSQALAAGWYYNAERIILGFVHAPDVGEASIITDEVSLADLTLQHLPALHRAWKRIGDGSMRPWEPKRDGVKPNWCTSCRVRDECPVSARDLIVDAADALGRAIVQKGGELVNAGAAGKIISRERLGQIIKQRSVIATLSEKLGPMIQADISANGPAYYNGKVYTVETTAEWDCVSIGSITRALGKVRGAREIERLRKLGAIEKRSQTKIQGRNE